MLSKKAKYGLKALIALAKEYGQGPMLISTISEKEHIPKKFLEAILLELKNAGILGSKKGAGGGYYLIKQPEVVKLDNILRLIDGPIALLPCVSLNYYETCEECENEFTCSIRAVALEVRDSTLNILSGTSLQDMLDNEKKLMLSKKK
jgi:Rrf2 family protein